MNCQAASAALEIVRIKFDVGDNVGDLCAGLVPLFAEAGLTQNAIEALAYLREQAKQKRLTSAKIESVRAFFDVLPQRPTLAFARPRSGEDEEEG